MPGILARKGGSMEPLEPWLNPPLLRIKVDAPPLAQWDPSAAVDLWWKDKTQRVKHRETRAAPSRNAE